MYPTSIRMLASLSRSVLKLRQQYRDLTVLEHSLDNQNLEPAEYLRRVKMWRGMRYNIKGKMEGIICGIKMIAVEDGLYAISDKFVDLSSEGYDSEAVGVPEESDTDVPDNLAYLIDAWSKLKTTTAVDKCINGGQE